jgi:hypothetical protein
MGEGRAKSRQRWNWRKLGFGGPFRQSDPTAPPRWRHRTPHPQRGTRRSARAHIFALCRCVVRVGVWAGDCERSALACAGDSGKGRGWGWLHDAAWVNGATRALDAGEGGGTGARFGVGSRADRVYKACGGRVERGGGGGRWRGARGRVGGAARPPGGCVACGRVWKRGGGRGEGGAGGAGWC